MNKSKIEWCDYTWNPVTGCLHGCDYCYAERIANRFSTHGNKLTGSIHVIDNPMCGYKSHEPIDSSDVRHDPYPYCFEPTFHRYRLDEPQKLKKPSRIFVVSMGDLFGEWVPDEWITEVLKACEAAPRNTYLFLTKNPKRFNELQFSIPLPTSAKYWYGTTVNNSADFISPCRAEELSRLIGHKKFLSIEPLLGEIKGIALENLKCFDWVIVGAQTGPGAKPSKPEWVQSIIDECRAVGVPMFLKDNLNWPEKIQEFPEGM